MKDFAKDLLGDAKFTKVFTDLSPGMLLTIVLMLFYNGYQQRIKKEVEDVWIHKITQTKTQNRIPDEQNIFDCETTHKKAFEELQSIKINISKLEDTFSLPSFIAHIKMHIDCIIVAGIMLGMLISQISRYIFIENCYRKQTDKHQYKKAIGNHSSYYYYGKGLIHNECSSIEELTRTFYNYTEICVNHIIPIGLFGLAILYVYGLNGLSLGMLFVLSLVVYILYKSGCKSYLNLKERTGAIISGALDAKTNKQN